MEGKLKNMVNTFMDSDVQKNINIGLYHIFKAFNGIVNLDFSILNIHHEVNIIIIIRNIQVYNNRDINTTLNIFDGTTSRSIDVNVLNGKYALDIPLTTLDKMISVSDVLDFEIGLSVTLTTTVTSIVNEPITNKYSRTSEYIGTNVDNEHINYTMVNNVDSYYITGITIVHDNVREFTIFDVFEICMFEIVIVSIPMVVIMTLSNVEHRNAQEFIYLDLELITNEKRILIDNKYTTTKIQIKSSAPLVNVHYIITESKSDDIGTHTIIKYYTKYTKYSNFSNDSFVKCAIGRNIIGTLLVADSKVQSVEIVNTTAPVKYTQNEIDDCYQKVNSYINPEIANEIYLALSGRLPIEMIDLIIHFTISPKILYFLTTEPFVHIKNINLSAGARFVTDSSIRVFSVMGGILWTIYKSETTYTLGMCVPRYRII